MLLELKEILKMNKLPRKIECYDISNLSGKFVVAGMCVMQDANIKKNLSRRFKIKTVIGQDDPRCMIEVITRRLRHSIDILNDGKFEGFGQLPDTIFVDGGITQIRAAKEAIADIRREIVKIDKDYDWSKVDIPIFGMVKDDKHSTRALIDENRQELPLSENLMNLITNFQDTVHDTAIGYHKKLRDKEITKSELDEIDGIGEVKKRDLLKKFGSTKQIADADILEISKVKGINEELARKIKEKLNNM